MGKPDNRDEPVKNKVRYFFEIAFKGTAYHGWQVQKNAETVQGELNRCLQMLLQEPVNCAGCGRTDAGVHAKSFLFHISVHKVLDGNFLSRLRKVVPRDIRIIKLYTLSEPGHARFSALKRTYKYHILLGNDPFLTDLVTFFRGPVDLDAMNKASELITGTHDFSAFAKSGSDQNNNLCSVYEAYWEQNGNEIVFTVSANRFLRRMVRLLTATLVNVGNGKLSTDDFRKILESRDPGNSAKAAPPDGLYLVAVEYPEGLLHPIPDCNIKR